MNYTTVAVLKTRLGITVSTYDTTLTAILTGVEASVNTYLGFDPSVTSITEYLDTRDSYTVGLKRWPVSSVTTVYLDTQGYYGQNPSGFDPTTTLLTEGVDYAVVIDQGTRAGVLYRINQTWPYLYQRIGGVALTALPGVCPGCLKVAYVVDNTAIIAVAPEAAYLEAAARWKASPYGFGIVMSDSMDGASVSVSPMKRNNDRKDPSDGFVSELTAGFLQAFRVGRFV